ncbi:hypothetical protein BDR04DRAFT_1025036, partial [Suillus decipiens]
LHDESVETRCRTWLSNIQTGQVTPHALQNALHTTILPELGIIPKQPISEQTARHWLIKLGWRRTVIRKGVYMDGHEREDVVKYRNEIYLPAMSKFEKRMVRFEGPELTRVEPTLQPGEKQIKPYYHDECCFHANDDVKSAWLRPGERVLRKKGRGRLIHVSDFVNEEDGQLVSRGPTGKIIKDAQRIIYPGANGDAWWTHENLLEQVKYAIEVHDEVNGPNCQALFIFDNSSAHASLPPDALRAFEMNKSDSGKQRKQRDTIIPDSNPDPTKHGLLQKMTTPSGEPKGLKSVLEERGFNIQGLRAKCAPYWGWCKYRYRQIAKRNFNEAKKAALEVLDACPVEVIRRFINRSYRFLSAYRLGLTGKAAEWAVRKQKQHRAVSQQAMMAIEAVLSQ